MKNPVIIAGEELGGGAESLCYRVEAIHCNHDGTHYSRKDQPPGSPDHVIKIPRPVKGAWQVNTRPFREKCARVLRDEEINHIPIAIVEDPTIILQKPEEKTGPAQVSQPRIAQLAPLIPDFDDLTFQYKHLFDPAIQEQLIELAKKAERIIGRDHIGIDPYGAEIMSDLFSGIKEEAFEILYRLMPKEVPEYIRGLIRSRITGVQGRMRNVLVGQDTFAIEGEAINLYKNYSRDESGRIVILQHGKLCLTDIGMHDLSATRLDDDILGITRKGVGNTLKKEPVKVITVPMNRLMWSTLIELLIHANPELAKRKDLPFTREKGIGQQIVRDTYRAIARQMVRFMTPKFERHDAQ